MAPDALVDNKAADNIKIFEGCPVLKANGGPGITPLSAVKLTRRRHWHITMHHWCPTPAAKECVLAMLGCEMRQAVKDLRASRRATRSSAGKLPLLPPEVWLHILTFVRRDRLGA